MVGIRLHSIPTLALHVCLLLVWCNSFPKGCSETSARALRCALFCAMIAGGVALGFSLVSPFLVKRRFRSTAWPPFETAERDLIEKYLLGSKRRLWSAVTKPPNEVADDFWSSRESFGGYILWLGRRMKPLIVRFQGQICLFTCPVFGLYKYILISGSQSKSSDPKNPREIFRETWEKKLKDHIFNSLNPHPHASIII